MNRFHLHALPSERWKNGGGNTRTIASFPAREPFFDWRISIAEIVESGPFSRFPDVDRVAVVLENGPLRLIKAGPAGQGGQGRDQNAQALLVGETHGTIAFDGADEYFADIAGDTILCLNVMTRRGAAAAEVRIISANTIVDGKANTLLFSAGKGWQVGARHLDRYEGVILDRDIALNIRAPLISDGPLIAIVIGPAPVS